MGKETVFQKMIDIAFCVNDAYVPYICVTVKSFLENNRECSVFFHILTDYISPEKRSLLDEVLSRSPSTEYAIYIVDDSEIAGLKTGSWTKYTWYRVLLPSILSATIQRVLYLDADTLVLGQIQDLFKIDLQGKAVAGCLDPQSFLDSTYLRCGYSKDLQYFCAGVLLINLTYWRMKHLSETIRRIAFEQGDRHKFPDQDALNIACKDCKVVLPLRFGIQGSFFTQDQFMYGEFASQLRDCINDPAIVHYAGQAPWKKEWANHPFQKEWEHYNHLLKHPAKRYYLTRGLPFIKMMLWKMVHLRAKRVSFFSRSDFIKRLDELS